MEPLIFTSHHWLHRDQFDIDCGICQEDCLFLLEKGAFHCAFDNENHMLVHDGDFIFFPKGISFERQILEPIDFHLIRFTRNDADPMAKELPHGLVSLGDYSRKHALLQLFQQLAGREDDFSHRMKQHSLNDVFFQYLYETARSETTSVRDAVEDTICHLDTHFTQVVSLEALAQQTELSPSALSRSFKHKTGITPTEYAVRLRMDRARHLLTFTADTVTTIAAQCGYCNVHYFSAVFKKECGCTPSEFRQTLPHV